MLRDGLDGQQLTLLNVGAHTVTLAGRLAGGGELGTEGTNLTRRTVLRPGAKVTLRWTDDGWAPTDHHDPQVSTSDDGIAVYGGDHQHPQVGLGTSGLPHLRLGPGGTSAPDLWLARASAGVATLGSRPDTADGVLRAGVVEAGTRQGVNARTDEAYTVLDDDRTCTIVRNAATTSTQTWPSDVAAPALAIGTLVRTFNRGGAAVAHRAGPGAVVIGGGDQPTNTWWTAQKIEADTWAVGPG